MYSLLVQTRREHLSHPRKTGDGQELQTLGVLRAGQSPVLFPKGKILQGSKPFFKAKPSLANNIYHVHDIKFHFCFFGVL